MAQIVEANPRQAGPTASGLPDHPEVARPQPQARSAEEKGSVALGAHEAAEVLLESRHDRTRHVDLAGVAVFGTPELEPAVVELVQGALDPDGAAPKIDVLPVEPEDFAAAQCAPGSQRYGDPVLLGHRLGQRRHLIDVRDAAIRHLVRSAALHPARVLRNEVVEDGGVEDRLEEPVGRAGSARRPGGDIRVPGSDVNRRDLGELEVTEYRFQPVLDEKLVLLTSARSNVSALGQPQIGVAGERDPSEFRVDPVAPTDGGRGGVQEGICIGSLSEGRRSNMPLAIVPVACLVEAARQTPDVAEVSTLRSHCSSSRWPSVSIWEANADGSPICIGRAPGHLAVLNAIGRLCGVRRCTNGSPHVAVRAKYRGRQGRT
ncbi:MAG TPA: hypothetical protein VMF35_08195 [Acidimicrobiales bacterium]|nr:hypothetical protein [Acidimicrobiales bacterium]